MLDRMGGGLPVMAALLFLYEKLKYMIKNTRRK